MTEKPQEMGSASGITAEENGVQKKYKGIRRRKWGKWVSEIRVPGSQERLWLGSYATPEAAAVAHDVAFYCLRRPPSLDGLNFPLTLPASLRGDMSPKSVQRAASDAGMAVDAQMITNKKVDDDNRYDEIEVTEKGVSVMDQKQFWEDDDESVEYCGKREENELSISVYDYLK